MSTQPSSEFVSALTHLKIGDLWPRTKRVISLRSTDTVAHAQAVLAEHQILSVPVLPEGGGEVSVETVGVVDVLDLALFAAGLSPKDVTSWDSLTRTDQNKLIIAGEKFEKATLADVLELKAAWKTDYQHTFIFSLEDNLQALLEAFNLGVHRALIVTSVSDKSLYSTVSQSDVADLLAQMMPLLSSDLRNRTVGEHLALLPGDHSAKKLHTAPVDKPALRVLLEDMNMSSSRQSLSAVPLLDKNGKIAATFSASNLLGIDRHTFDDLAMPVGEFVAYSDMGNRSFRGALAQHRALHPLTVTEKDTLENALFKMVATRVHRLWVVDADKKPVGVLAQSDVFGAFLPWGSNKAR